METMATFGFQAQCLISPPTPAKDIGFIPHTDGHGYRIIPGDGPCSIMAAGAMITITDGSGFPVWNGGLPGLHGGIATATTDGLLYLPV